PSGLPPAAISGTSALRHDTRPNIGTVKVPERYEEGGPETTGPDRSGLPPIPWFGPAVAPIHAASGVGYGLGFAGNTHRHVPDGWAAGGEVPRRGARRRRQRA